MARKYIRKIILILLLCIAVTAVTPAVVRAVYPLRYSDIIYKTAKQYDLNEFLVMGLIKAESNYIHDAQSKVAYGLMQITENTAKDIAEQMNISITGDDLTDPHINIELGCYYLKFLYNYYGNMDLALAAYNGGMGNVNKWLADSSYSLDGKKLHNIPFEETRRYVKNVNKYALIYYRLYA